MKQMNVWAVIACVVVVAVCTAAVSAVTLRADQLYSERENIDNVHEGIRLLEDVLRQDDTDYESLWRLARFYEWLGRESVDKTEQLEYFEQGNSYGAQAMKINDTGAEGRYWYALTLGRVGELRGVLRSLAAANEMRAELERVIELQPDLAGAHYALGMLYHMVPGWPLSYGNKKEARRLMEQATVLWPENTTYLLGLAELMLAAGERAEGRQLLEQIIEMPLTPGEHIESRQDKEEARQLLDRLS